MTVFHWFNRMRKAKKINPITPTHALEEDKNLQLTGDLDELVFKTKALLGENDDLIIRHFRIFGQFQAVLLYFQSMVNQSEVSTHILKPLMNRPPQVEQQNINASRLTDILINDVLYFSDGKSVNQLTPLIESIILGNTIVAVEGLQEAFVISTQHIEKRAIDQPETEQVIRGPHEGFIESLSTNVSLIRNRLHTPDLRFKSMVLGRQCKSKVAIFYIKGIANPDLVQEVEKRLSIIDIDGVLDSGYLEQFIEDNHYSPFPQVQYTEKPDKVVANLLEGKVTIMLDGSPVALVVPTVFSQFYQTVEDYTERFITASAVRLTRFVALIFSLVFPSLYVAVISFNPELIPTEFAVAVAGGRAGVPFPAVVEILVIEIAMEVLREATIRLPQQVGGALSIVGVLVIGQAAVAAGFASPITIVIIALTTIGSFATPAYNAALALRLLRFPLIILAGIFGLYGIMIGLILIVNHMLSLKSFGVPYISPLVPGNREGIKDLFIRSPLWTMKTRPDAFYPQNKTLLNQDAAAAVKTMPSNVLDPANFADNEGEQGNGKSASNNSNTNNNNPD